MKKFSLFLLAPLFLGVMSSLLAFPMEEEKAPPETAQNNFFFTRAGTRAGADDARSLDAREGATATGEDEAVQTRALEGSALPSESVGPDPSFPSTFNVINIDKNQRAHDMEATQGNTETPQRLQTSLSSAQAPAASEKQGSEPRGQTAAGISVQPVETTPEAHAAIQAAATRATPERQLYRASDAGAGSDTGISRWMPAVSCDNDGSDTWRDVVLAQHAGFDNQPYIEDSCFGEVLSSGNMRTAMSIFHGVMKGRDQIPIEELTHEEKDHLLSALQTIKQQCARENEVPCDSLEQAIAFLKDNRVALYAHMVKGEEMPEAVKLKFLYALKTINRLSRDPEWVDKKMANSIRLGFSENCPRKSGHNIIGKWNLTPQQKLEALRQISSDPNARIKLNPRQRAEIQAAIRILDFFVSNDPDSRPLPPAANRLVLHYSQLRTNTSMLDISRDYGPEVLPNNVFWLQSQNKELFPALTPQQLETTVRELIAELARKSLIPSDFISFLKGLLPSSPRERTWAESASAVAESVINYFSSSAKSSATADQKIESNFSQHFDGLAIHDDDTLNFNEEEVRLICEEAISNIANRNINLPQLTEPEQAALFNDLCYIIELTNASAAAPPTTLNQALEHVRLGTFLQDALTYNKRFDEETKQHLFYAMKNINRMSLDPASTAREIDNRLLNSHGHASFVNFYYRSFETRMTSGFVKLLNDWDQDRNFQIKASNEQKEYLQQTKEILNSGNLLRAYFSTFPQSQRLLSTADYNRIYSQVNIVLRAILRAAQPSTAEGALDPEKLATAKAKVIETITEIQAGLENNMTPEAVQLYAALQAILDEPALAPVFDYVLK